MALGALVAVIAGQGVYRAYVVHRSPDADLIITGRTPEIDPPVAARPAVARRDPSVAKPTDPPPPAECVVHVAGAVKHPGVFHLSVSARAEDALKAAGGATPTAQLDAINLAAHVEDGEQLYVPTKSEHPTGGSPGSIGGASPSGKGQSKSGAAAHPPKLSKPGQGSVNLNTATADELQRLPGVGPAMAERILEHRKVNGGFRQPEDLMDVSGIGPKKFEKMKPFVRVH